MLRERGETVEIMQNEKNGILVRSKSQNNDNQIEIGLVDATWKQ